MLKSEENDKKYDYKKTEIIDYVSDIAAKFEYEHIDEGDEMPSAVEGLKARISAIVENPSITYDEIDSLYEKTTQEYDRIQTAKKDKSLSRIIILSLEEIMLHINKNKEEKSKESTQNDKLVNGSSEQKPSHMVTSEKNTKSSGKNKDDTITAVFSIGK